MEVYTQIFHDKLRAYTITSVSGKPFVLTEHLKLWLDSRPDELGGQTVLEHLFNCTALEVGQTTPPWDCDSVLTFCILLQLGLGHRLSQFARLTDDSLPLSRQDLSAIFHPRKESSVDAVDGFFETQWQYCPAAFELVGIFDWQPDIIIPICAQNPIAKGRTASIYEVVIPEDFVGPRLRNASQIFRFEHPELTPGWYYRFALKTFDRWNTDLGNKEMTMSRMLGYDEHFAVPLLAFTSTESHPPSPDESTVDSTKTFNLLLELADMDLGYYFASKDPPVTPGEIEKFWTSMSDIAEDLRRFHEVPYDLDGGMKGPREQFGYHHDVKPSNILLIGNHLKLSDFGFAAFLPSCCSEIPPSAATGTISYGPPEPSIYTFTNLTVESLQEFDLWSLGCVFSEAATWVVLGSPGIKIFSRLRRKALDKLCTAYDTNHPQVKESSKTKIPRRGDYFHDGNDVLEVVTSWHRFLRSSVRRSDVITTKVLDILDEGLLVSNISKRVDAKTLCVQLSRVIEGGEREGRLLPTVDLELAGLWKEVEDDEGTEEDVRSE